MPCILLIKCSITFIKMTHINTKYFRTPSFFAFDNDAYPRLNHLLFSNSGVILPRLLFHTGCKTRPEDKVASRSALLLVRILYPKRIWLQHTQQNLQVKYVRPCFIRIHIILLLYFILHFLICVVYTKSKVNSVSLLKGPDTPCRPELIPHRKVKHE